MRYFWSLAIISTMLLCVSCGEDDCYYCGKDITKGVIPDTETPVIPVDRGTSQPDSSLTPDDNTEAVDEATSDGNDLDVAEISDRDVVTADTMVVIPETTYSMGCEENVAPSCTETNSLPRHEVTVPEFSMDIYEITKKEYAACIAEGGCLNDPDNDLLLYKTMADSPFCVLDNGTYTDTHPVNCVSWLGARAYCEWVGKRLPSEAEWELAARGTDGRYYPWGDTPIPSCDNSVLEGPEDWGCDQGLSLPVGSKPQGISPYGLYDMAGNMWEWVEDDWHDDYGDLSRPDDGSAWVDAIRPPNRVIRGGSFMTSAEDNSEFLTYARFGSPAYDTYISRGFRCAQ
ncbi:MAG TPA: formylglycine-generating enzyme family protein [bacterium]|nr:formylglycine-generating enzyme family protein [bacterium]